MSDEEPMSDEEREFLPHENHPANNADNDLEPSVQQPGPVNDPDESNIQPENEPLLRQPVIDHPLAAGGGQPPDPIPSTSATDVPELNWLADLHHLSLTEVAYDTDTEGKQTFYYVIRIAEKRESLCILQCRPDGLLRIIDVVSIDEQFCADSTLNYNSMSKVYIKPKDGSEREQDRKVLGYIEKRWRILDSQKTPYLNIYFDKEADAGSNHGQSYYIQRHNVNDHSATRISPVPTHRCLLIQFGAETDVVSKAIIICFTQKVYRTYYKLDFKSLKLFSGLRSMLEGLTEYMDRKLSIPLHLAQTDWQKSISIPYESHQKLAEADTNDPVLETVSQFYIEKVGYTHDCKASYYFVRTKSTAKPMLVIDTRIAETLYAHVKNVDSLQIMFSIDSIFRHHSESQIVDSLGIIGHVIADKVYDSNGDEIMMGSFKEVKHDLHSFYNYTMMKGTNVYALISFSMKSRQLTVTLHPEAEPLHRILILSFAIKIMYNVCKLHTDVIAEYSSLDELIEHERNNRTRTR